MRRLLSSILFCFTAISLWAQSLQDSVNLKPMLFETFLDGEVLMKSGVVERAPLNYNTDNQTVVFIQKGQYMVIGDLETVDTIYLQHKKFIPVYNRIFQVVTPSLPVTLLVSYTNKVKPLVATTDHSGTARQSMNQASNMVTDVYTSRNFKGTYSVEIHRHYWFKINDKLYKVTPQKQFVSSFSSKKRKAVEKYIKESAIDFKNEADLIKLIAFCNEN